MIKKIAAISAILLTLPSRMYNTEGNIIYSNDNVYIAETLDGEMYAFEGYGFYIGDSVIMTMDNMGTLRNKTDDEIVEIEPIEIEIR